MILTSVLALLLKAVIAQLQCYNPDGGLTDHTPCNDSAKVTHCCQSQGACLTSGLCFMAYDHSLNTGSCSDMTWEDPSCFQFCLKGMPPLLVSQPRSYRASIISNLIAENKDLANGYIDSLSVLYRCDDNEWCCSPGGNLTSCCPDGKRQFQLISSAYIQHATILASGLTIAPIREIAATSSGIPSTTTGNTAVTSSTSSEARQTTDPSPPASSSSGDNNTKVTKVGVGSGLGVGLPLLAILVGTLYMLQRERNQNKELKQRLAAVVGAEPKNGFGQNSSTGHPRELSGYQDTELPASIPTSELPGAHSSVRY